MDTPSPLESLQKAVAIAGSQAAMARLCDVTQPAVHYWLTRTRLLPPEHVIAVEGRTGVSRHLLRPDIYPASSADLPGDVAPGAAPVPPNRTGFSVDRKRA